MRTPALTRSASPRAAAAPQDSADLRTVVFMATALPRAAADDLVAVASAVVSHLLGPEHIVDISGRDGSTIAITLGIRGGAERKIIDPALGPALEAELSAALRAAGHENASLAIASSGLPRSPSERALELWKAKLAELASQSMRLAEDSAFRKEIARMLEQGAIRTVFQPIVAAQGWRLLGYEALSRGPEGHAWERPDLLLEAAERAGLSSLVQWEMLQLGRVRAATRINSSDCLLFLNAPDTRFWPEAPPSADDSTQRIWPWDRTVSEVSERTPIANLPSVWKMRDRGRDLGVRYALDDVGAGYAGLAALALLAPDYVKIDMAIVRACHQDRAKQAVISALVQYAARSSANVIAEGIETVEELEVVSDLGVDFIQGFLVAPPAEEPPA